MGLGADRKSAVITHGEPMHSEPRTYIIFGSMRGGTSMVAGVMRGLGVHIGPDVDENNQESKAFNGPSVEDMKKSLQAQNVENRIWGWKNPSAADYLDQIWPEIRNPHLICVMRDPVANAQGLNRWHPMGRIQSAQESVLRLQKNLNMISLRRCPSLMISYEKAINAPNLFVDEFGAWLGVDANAARKQFNFSDFMQPSSYKPFNEYKLT